MLQQNPRDVSAMTGDSAGQQLERLDILLGKLGMGLEAEEALEIPALLDMAYERVEKTDPDTAAGKGAAARFESASQTFRKNLAVFLREVGDPARLDAARRAVSTPADHWWWQPEQVLAAERTAAAKKNLRGLAIGVAVLAVLVIVYQLFLRPSPQVIAVMDGRRAAEELIAGGGDPRDALAEIEQALLVAPGDSELLTLKGCLLTLIGGKEEEAQAAFAEAEKALGNREHMLLMSAQNYVIFAQPELARTNAEAAIALNPESGQGYLILGQALEDLNDDYGAYQAYEKASSLGNAKNDATITAQARLKMGILMQSMGMESMFQDMGVTPTP